MKSEFKKIFIIAIIPLFLFFAVKAVNAQLVPCSGVDCTVCDLLKLISNITLFIVRNIMPPLAGLLFLVGGIIMVSSAGSEERYKKGRTVLINTAIGVVIVLFSWIIVNTLIVTIGQSSESIQVGNWWNPAITCVAPPTTTPIIIITNSPVPTTNAPTNTPTRTPTQTPTKTPVVSSCVSSGGSCLSGSCSDYSDCTAVSNVQCGLGQACCSGNCNLIAPPCQEVGGVCKPNYCNNYGPECAVAFCSGCPDSEFPCSPAAACAGATEDSCSAKGYTCRPSECTSNYAGCYAINSYTAGAFCPSGNYCCSGPCGTPPPASTGAVCGGGACFQGACWQYLYCTDVYNPLVGCPLGQNCCAPSGTGASFTDPSSWCKAPPE